MDDLIRRQAAIEICEIAISLWDGQLGTGVLMSVKKNIQNLPPAQPEPKWISVEQKLPDNDNTVLITHRGGVSFGWYNGRYWERGASTNHRKLQTVTAWMPLPEPYAERSRNG